MKTLAMSSRAWIVLPLVLAACGGPFRGMKKAPPEVTKIPVVRLEEPARTAPRKAAPVTEARVLTAGEYQVPPSEVVSLLEREGAPQVIFHAGSRRLIRRYVQQLMPAAQVSEPQVSLAGLRIRTGNSTLASELGATRLRVSSVDTPSDVKELRPPAGQLFGPVEFSPDGSKLLVSVLSPDELRVAVFRFEAGELEILPTPPLSSVWGFPCRFVEEEKVLCFAAKSGPRPEQLPVGPRIHELKSGAVPTRTYSDLLQGKSDDVLFEHYASVRLLVGNLSGEPFEELPFEGLFSDASTSPDGQFVLLSRVVAPYSRLVPAEKFPVELVVAELQTGHELTRISPDTSTTSTRAALGPRWGAWDPDSAASLAFVSREIRADGLVRERVLSLSAPFEAQPAVVRDDLPRVSYLGWSSQGQLAFTETRADGSWKSFLGREKLVEVHAGKAGDVIGDFGKALGKHGDGKRLLHSEARFFFSREQQKEGRTRTVVVAWDSKNKSEIPIWNSAPGQHAVPLGLLDESKNEILLTSETPHVPVAVFVSVGGKRRAVSAPASSHPELQGVERRPFKAQRSDGVLVRGDLYLPKKRPKHSIPTVIFLYPRDYTDEEQANQAPLAPERYFEVSGPSRYLLLTQGYALLDIPAFPIVGQEKGERTDFVPQLLEGARSVVDGLAELGIAQRDDVYVMGRSYGAFAVANLLAHSTLFRTGIAVSGAYNRTLTPFGFQNETRTFWQNTEAYVRMSPFFYADAVQGSLLLIHGERDENAGTPLLQSERFYAALVGNGVRARYVALPDEGHQFRGREGVLHTAWEILTWLNAARAPRGQP